MNEYSNILSLIHDKVSPIFVKPERSSRYKDSGRDKNKSNDKDKEKEKDTTAKDKENIKEAADSVKIKHTEVEDNATTNIPIQNDAKNDDDAKAEIP